MANYRIGQAAEAIGVRVETLRRWEREGKLTTVRTSGGQRMVPAAEVARGGAPRGGGKEKRGGEKRGRRAEGVNKGKRG
ncbi:MAG: MerR family DNA-binding transcriptional regulator, partial [Actinomycetota bacterium]